MSDGIDPSALDALLTRARREVDEGLLPSCQLAIARHGELVALETIGAATDSSRYVIFSCTKALIAGAVWLQLAAGAFTLEQPVAELIPGFGDNGKGAVTVEQLLVHQSGFPAAPLGLATTPGRQERLERYRSWRLNWEPG